MNLRSILPASPHTKLLNDRKVINEAIETTKAEITAAEAAVAQRRRQLGESDAEVVLGIQPADDAGARKQRAELRQAVEDLENLHSRREALAQRLEAANRALLDLEPKLAADRDSLVQKRLSRWTEDYRKAAKALHQLILTGRALAHVSNDGGLIKALEAAFIPDPERVDDNLAENRAVRKPGAVDRYDVVESWELNAAAVREHQVATAEVEELDEALKAIGQLRASGGWK